jgi:hypothetical protein
MPKTHRSMRLSSEEEQFLRHWIHDELSTIRKAKGPRSACSFCNGQSPLIWRL